MYTVIVTIHIIVCIILVLTVLLQQGKGAEVGAVFGSSEAMFGSAGPASALNKVTTVVAIVFMITSLTLTYLAAHRKGDSVMEHVKVEAPAVPAASQSELPAAQPDEHQTNEKKTSQSAVIPAGQPHQKTGVQQAAPTTMKDTEAPIQAEKAASAVEGVDKSAGSKPMPEAAAHDEGEKK